MSPHTVLGLVSDEAQHPVVLLAPVRHPSTEEILVPIWLDASEAALISAALSGRRPALPVAHDLLEAVLEELAGVVDRCELRIDDRDAFEATLVITSWTDPLRLICRPADGIALAVRAGAPVDVAGDVIDRCGVILESLGEVADIEAPAVSAFRRFLDDVQPADFARPVDGER